MTTRNGPSNRELTVVRRLRRILLQGRWVALDTETTGLGPGAEVVEVAIADEQGICYESLVRPDQAVSAGASRVHQISEEKLAVAPPFESIAAEVRRHLVGKTVLGYNVDFDRRMLWRAFAKAHQPAPACRWMCLSKIVIALTGQRLSLDMALRSFDLSIVEPRHRAGGDAQSVILLAKKIVENGTL